MNEHGIDLDHHTIAKRDADPAGVALSFHPSVHDLVWDPPWNQNMISEAGRMKLGMV